jgi:hypothetical protein
MLGNVYPSLKKKKKGKNKINNGQFRKSPLSLSLSLYLSLDKLQRGTKASMRRLQQHTDKMAHWRPMRSHLIISPPLFALPTDLLKQMND